MYNYNKIKNINDLIKSIQLKTKNQDSISKNQLNTILNDIITLIECNYMNKNDINDVLDKLDIQLLIDNIDINDYIEISDLKRFI